MPQIMKANMLQVAIDSSLLPTSLHFTSNAKNKRTIRLETALTTSLERPHASLLFKIEQDSRNPRSERNCSTLHSPALIAREILNYAFIKTNITPAQIQQLT